MSGIVTPGAMNNAAQAHPIASTDHHATDSPGLQSLASVAAIGARSLYLTAAPKLPLAIVWDFWVAWVLAVRGRVNLS